MKLFHELVKFITFYIIIIIEMAFISDQSAFILMDYFQIKLKNILKDDTLTCIKFTDCYCAKIIILLIIILIIYMYVSIYIQATLRYKQSWSIFVITVIDSP